MDGIENYAVYLANPDMWSDIELQQSQIIRRECAGLKVLDAGCAYGRISEWVENYTGVDISPDFIERARAKYPGKQFAVADLRTLPFADKEFDIAVCVSIKDMVIDNLGGEVWDIMEKELHRVAKKILLIEYLEGDHFKII